MLIRILLAWAHHSKVEVISGHGSDTPYLIRYHLLNNRFCKLYLHYFLRSDLDDPHDHPWDFWTYMLQGSYTEELYDWRTRSFKRIYRCNFPDTHGYGPEIKNVFMKRKATDIHRIVVDESVTMDTAEMWRKAPMTLFFAFRKYQDWGFIENYREGPSWKLWSQYLAEKFGEK